MGDTVKRGRGRPKKASTPPSLSHAPPRRSGRAVVDDDDDDDDGSSAVGGNAPSIDDSISITASTSNVRGKAPRGRKPSASRASAAVGGGRGGSTRKGAAAVKMEDGLEPPSAEDDEEEEEEKDDSDDSRVGGTTSTSKKKKVKKEGAGKGRPPKRAAGWLKPEEAEEMFQRRDEVTSQLNSLTGGKLLTKCTVPPKGEVHWDFLLKEMQWMATDFKDEREGHARLGRKFGKAVLQHFRAMGSREERLAREQHEKLRRVAYRMARDVKGFWHKINKVVAFKQKLEVDEQRKRAMDKHLGFLVQQTERYSTMVAKNMLGMREEGPGRIKRRKRKHRLLGSDAGAGAGGESMTDGTEGWEDEEEGDNDSFAPSGEEEEEEDDTSLAQQEEVEKEGYTEEVMRLKKEADLPPEELRKLYYGSAEGEAAKEEHLQAKEGEEKMDGGMEEEEDEDAANAEGYVPMEEEAEDDEASLAEQEEIEKRTGYAEELSRLQQENELSVEELRKLYYGDNGPTPESEEEGEEEEEEGEEEQGNDGGGGDDDEFVGEEVIDDEGSIAAAEEAEKDGYAEEIEHLKREAEMSPEELRRLYYGADEDGHVNGLVEREEAEEEAEIEDEEGQEEEKEEGEDENGEDEYVAEEEEDDEASLAEQEEAEKGGYTAELEDLEREKELSVEELRRLYYGEEGPPADDDDDDDDDQEGGDMEVHHQDGKEAAAAAMMQADGNDGNVIMAAYSSSSPPTKLIERAGETSTEKGDSSEAEGEDAVLQRLEDMDEKARSVAVDRPFLLSPKLKLREYQHIGLNWLVSLFERRLNGILADEMGLGKTIQTISLLAYLAAHRGIWGPHLIVVPTSCIVNWEAEFKRWCPGFKILTYYGSAPHRKVLRQGWTKPNSFHIVITSYQLVVQDASSFKRKRWYFLILDEAHNIKNFKSQRWQTLLTFNSHRRLLLTGTPLQNDLMELWSLMHFLMPHVFRSRKEFSYWFSNPLTSMVEGSRAISDSLIKRLHTIMRPFLLRRLKKDVEKQLPGKVEHIVMCPLSRRQLHLYEEFMARSSTRAALAGGNFMGMMNVLMQLRKVCNHPDLFEPRPIVSAYTMPPIVLQAPLLALRALQRPPLKCLSSQLIAPLWPEPDEKSLLHRVWQLCAPSDYIRQVDAIDLSSRSRLAASDPVVAGYLAQLSRILTKERQEQHELMAIANERRCGKLLLGDPPTTTSCKEDDQKAMLARASWGVGPFTKRALHAGTSLLERAVLSKTDPKLRCETPESLIEAVRLDRERAQDINHIVERFTCVIPKVRSSWPILVGKATETRSSLGKEAELGLEEIRTKVLAPFHAAAIRQTLCFPDRWLVQYDAGKLQTLAKLLRNLKRGGHRVLIFTQMTRMLDVLEAFLNLHGHVYLRLDGATGVDRRQKLMDRFNNDTKIFCFILSTRSGGLGVNLTGADTVIFYDSDWNPAMDAQAQDRAHRIGQTREVHIYRLVSERTIEENILKKARQRRHLDFLAITAGKFTPEQMYNSQTLQEMIVGGGGPSGAAAGQVNEEAKQQQQQQQPPPQQAVSAKDVQAAMAAMEDEADVEAMRGAEKETSEEMREFDDTAAPVKGEEEGGEEDDEEEEKGKTAVTSKAGKTEGAEGEGDDSMGDEEFAAFQNQLGPDVGAIEARLRPVERYAFHFRTVIEPFISLYYVSEEQRRRELEEEQADGEVDVEALEMAAAEEEARSLEEGEILATTMDMAVDAINRQETVYHKERARVKAEFRRRQMTGDNWNRRIDAISGYPFFYNEDTGEAQWDRPRVVMEGEADGLAREEGFSGLPAPVLRNIMSFLVPAPERMIAGAVCVKWRAAAVHFCFYKRVLPVEAGLKGANGSDGSTGGGAAGAQKAQQAEAAVKKGLFLSIQDALNAAVDGETILLEPGHHWEESLIVNKLVRIMGDTFEPSRVVIELTGGIEWRSKGGVLQTLTIRRPRQCLEAVCCLTVRGSKIDMVWCVLNNEGGNGAAIYVGEGGNVYLYCCTIIGAPAAGLAIINGGAALFGCDVNKNRGAGLLVASGCAVLIDCQVSENDGPAIHALRRSAIAMQHNDLTSNRGGTLRRAKGGGPRGLIGQPVIRGYKNLCNQNDEDLEAGLIGKDSYARSIMTATPLTVSVNSSPCESPSSTPCSSPPSLSRASSAAGGAYAAAFPLVAGRRDKRKRSNDSNGDAGAGWGGGEAESGGPALSRQRTSSRTGYEQRPLASTLPTGQPLPSALQYQQSLRNPIHQDATHAPPPPPLPAPYPTGPNSSSSYSAPANGLMQNPLAVPGYPPYSSYTMPPTGPPIQQAGGSGFTHYHYQSQPGRGLSGGHASAASMEGGGGIDVSLKKEKERVTVWDPTNTKKTSVLRKNLPKWLSEHPGWEVYNHHAHQQQAASYAYAGGGGGGAAGPSPGQYYPYSQQHQHYHHQQQQQQQQQQQMDPHALAQSLANAAAHQQHLHHQNQQQHQQGGSSQYYHHHQYHQAAGGGRAMMVEEAAFAPAPPPPPPHFQHRPPHHPQHPSTHHQQALQGGSAAVSYLQLQQQQQQQQQQDGFGRGHPRRSSRSSMS